ncbi:MAG: carbohydrate kinase family protein [Spirochaetaceae bacterium]|nr:MAG: carbohydrate kinase family protein [Spirochaetaceae bacterium]
MTPRSIAAAVAPTYWRNGEAVDITAELIRSLREDRSPEPTVTVIGDLGYDYIYTSPPLEGGKEVIIRNFTRTIAGAAGYFACGLARLGAKVCFLTELGDDPDGKQLYAEISGRGVDPKGIRMLENTRSYFTLIFADAAESSPRQVATYLGPLGEMSVRDLDYKSFVTGSDLVYSCNYFQLLRIRTEIEEVFSHTRNLGKLTAYDANAGDGWEDPQNLELLRKRIYPRTDVVFLNETEARSLTGEQDPLETVMKASPSSKIVVIKRGSAGVVLRKGKRVYRCPAFTLPKPVQDTVGAGDSFQAAFLYFYLKGLPLLHSAILGTANAAATVQHPGGVLGQQNRAGLASMLEQYSVLISRHDQVEIISKER